MHPHNTKKPNPLGNFHLRLTVIGLLTICFPSVQRKSPNSYFPRVVTLLACTITWNFFFSPIFVKVKDLGTTTMVYPAGELTFAVYVAGGPTLHLSVESGACIILCSLDWVHGWMMSNCWMLMMNICWI